MRLVDLDAVIDCLEVEWGYEGIREDLYSLPVVDAAPVARCKECEHAGRYERTDGTVGYYCGHPQNTFTYGERWDRVFKPVKEADDFCRYGKRRDDGKRGNDTGN